MFWIGNRFPIRSKEVVRLHDKPARRLLRRLAMLSPIEQKLRTIQRADLEVARLAGNSHERQRAIAADRKERA